MEKISFCRGHCPDLGSLPSLPPNQMAREVTSGNTWNLQELFVFTVENECVNKRGSPAWYLFSFSSPQPQITSNSNGLPHSICFQVHSPFCSKTETYSYHSSGQTPFRVPHCLRIEAALLRHKTVHPRPSPPAPVLSLSLLQVPSAPGRPSSEHVSHKHPRLSSLPVITRDASTH